MQPMPLSRSPHSIKWFRSFLLAIMLVAGMLAIPSGTTLAQITCEPATAAPATSASPEASPAAAADPYAGAEFPADGGSLTVFAAASLVDAFGTIEEQLETAHPGLDITVETAGSQTLVTQLTEGAEADVLATANNSTMQKAIDSGLIDGEAVTFTGNRLVIVTPPDNEAGVNSLLDLGNEGVQLVLAGADVPVGSYTRTALCQFSTLADSPAGLIDSINANVVSEEVDVRSVLAKVQIGEADAGIVYASDAVASQLAGDTLNVIEFPDSLDTTASYPIAPVAGGNAELAAAFIAYVQSPDGQQVLNDFGFTLPR
jgi:molybdate transport system substrate-binding protein